MTGWKRIVAIATLAGGVSTAAVAQEGNRFALGGSFTARGTDSPSAHGGRGPGIEWRFGHDKEGWGWQYGLNWYALDVDHNIGGRMTTLGELRVRPFMAGYGYTHVMGPLSVNTGVIAGFTFNGVTVSREAADAYGQLGGHSVTVQASHAPIVKPEIGLWYDLGRRMGLTANVGYLVTRPQLTVTSSMGREVQRYRADAVSVTFGAVYRLF